MGKCIVTRYYAFVFISNKEVNSAHPSSSAHTPVLRLTDSAEVAGLLVSTRERKSVGLKNSGVECTDLNTLYVCHQISLVL